MVQNTFNRYSVYQLVISFWDFWSYICMQRPGKEPTVLCYWDTALDADLSCLHLFCSIQNIWNFVWNSDLVRIAVVRALVALVHVHATVTVLDRVIGDDVHGLVIAAEGVDLGKKLFSVALFAACFFIDCCCLMIASILGHFLVNTDWSTDFLTFIASSTFQILCFCFKVAPTCSGPSWSARLFTAMETFATAWTAPSRTGKTRCVSSLFRYCLAHCVSFSNQL